MSDLQDAKLVSPRMVIFITHAEDQTNLIHAFESLHVPMCYQCLGKGTAPSEIMDIFGLSGTSRLVTIGVMPKFMAKELFENITRTMLIHQRGGGIALTVPITGLQSPMLHLMNDEAKEAWKKHIEERISKDMAEIKKESVYSMIWVSVNSGFSDDVIDAAREAGAKGGTVMKGRRRNSAKVSQNFGLPLQDEQDFVMIVVPKAKKTQVMSAICSQCGLNSNAHGIVLSMPVDEIMGLEE